MERRQCDVGELFHCCVDKNENEDRPDCGDKTEIKSESLPQPATKPPCRRDIWHPLLFPLVMMWSLWVGNDIMVSYSVTTISSSTFSPTPSSTSSSNTIPISSSSWWRCDHSGWPLWFHRSNTISSSQQFFQLFPKNSAEKEHFVLVSTNGLCSGKTVNINWKTGKLYFG